MLITDFLASSDQKKKILIVSDIKRANSLIRSHEIKYKSTKRNIDCRTLQQIATDVYKWIQSENGFTSPHEFIDQDEAQMFFRAVLLTNCATLPYFNNESIMNIATTTELFRMVNLIRGNGWTGKEPSESARDRINALKILVSAYEKELSDKNKMDTTALYQFLVSKLVADPSLSEELPMLFGAKLYYLKEDTDTYTGLQWKFLSLLGCCDEKQVRLFDIMKPDAEGLGDGKLSMADLKENESLKNADFFKGYGSFNEVNYVANDILKNKYPYGSVTVLYSSSSQLAAISSALQGNGIPMRLLSSHPITDNPYIALARRILAWARDDFSEKALNDVLASSVIHFVPEELEKPYNLFGLDSYFDIVLDARNRWEGSIVLGWGYERNQLFINSEKDYLKNEETEIKANTTYSEDERAKKLKRNQTAALRLQILHDLLDIFGDSGQAYSSEKKVRPSIIAEKLLHFIEAYTQKKNAEYPIGIGSIKEVYNSSVFETRDMSLDDCITYIDELLLACSSSDPEDRSAVNVSDLSDWRFIERPHLYVIGLSLKELQGRSAESPVLLDSEQIDLLGEGYKPTLTSEKDRKAQSILRTLMAFHGETVAYGYSSFDTTSSCDNNPSSFYREALGLFSKTTIDEVPEFIYGAPKSKLQFDVNSYEQKSFEEIKTELLSKAGSSSRMETLLSCPQQFAFTNVMYIPDNTFNSLDLTTWLNPLFRGSFFHHLVEKYIEKKLIVPATETYSPDVDTDFMGTLVDEESAKLKHSIPYPYLDKTAEETEKIRELTVEYLRRLVRDYIDHDWRALAVEQEYHDSNYSISAYDGNEWVFTIKNGSIDRIDYKLDRTNKKIILRIGDYKTGSQERKEEAFYSGKLIQYFVYWNALMNSGKTEDGTPILAILRDKVALLENDEEIKEWECDFDCFKYDFPDTPDAAKASLVITKDQMTNMDDEDNPARASIIRLKAILTVVARKCTYPDIIEFFDEVNCLADEQNHPEKEADEISTLQFELTTKDGLPADHCSHCKYEDLCKHRKSGEVTDK